MKILLSTILLTITLSITSLSATANDTLQTANGIKYVQITEGNGVHPISNQKVKIICCRTSSTGQFVESHDLSKPFEFRVDQRKVISGLDEIVKLMSKGEEVYCIIPAKLGHGEKGVKGYIDSNVTLYLYIQIVGVK